MTNRNVRNTSKKGSHYESDVLSTLLACGIKAKRTSSNSAWDIDAEGLPPIECKNHQVGRIPLWTSRLRALCGQTWVLFARIGDGRTADGHELVIMPVSTFTRLVQGDKF